MKSWQMDKDKVIPTGPPPTLSGGAINIVSKGQYTQNNRLKYCLKKPLIPKQQTTQPKEMT